MAKIKVVQITTALNNEEQVTYYLDDQGRVWYDNGKAVVDEENSKPGSVVYHKWVPKWEQIDLPEEPEE